MLKKMLVLKLFWIEFGTFSHAPAPPNEPAPSSPQAAFIKLPHKPPKVPTPPTPPTKPVTNTIPNHVPPVPKVPTASCTKLCPPGLIRGAVWGVSTCLQPKAQFCAAACAKPVPSFAKFHGDCCPQGSWTAAATPRMTQLRDDCCDCK